LLSRAKQHVQLEAAKLGRKPSIMDIIMELKSSACDYQEDVLVLIADRSQDASYLRREYVFTDDEELEAYWSDQAAIWDGVWHSAEGDVTRFPLSMERSTATWDTV
jgi:hypothetical protein